MAQSESSPTSDELVQAISGVVDRRMDKLCRDLEDKIAAYLVETPDKMDAVLESINEHKSEVDKLKNAVGDLKSELDEFLENAALRLIRTGPFLERYEKFSPTEKQHLADYVSSQYFANTEKNGPIKCFVQASSTSLYLGHVITTNAKVPSGCTVYTNSAVMHLPMVYGSSAGRHIIWPFCGKQFDPHCGGWLIPSDDHDALSALKALFDPNDKGLTTAFVMPYFVTPNEGVYYERSESALLADTVAAAENIVILATGDRIVEDSSKFPPGQKFYPAFGELWANSAGKVTLVVSAPQEPLPRIAEEMKNCGFSVHWESDSGWSEL